MISVAITEIITTLAEAEQRFYLSRTEDERFFLEWRMDLPDLTEAETSGLADLRRRYLYQRSLGHLLESTAMLLFASPLLTTPCLHGCPPRPAISPIWQVKGVLGGGATRHPPKRSIFACALRTQK